MKVLAIIGIMTLIMVKTGLVQAATLECNGDDIRIAGNIETRYLRMGHSMFSGNLTAYFYKDRVIVNTADILVISGDLQDDEGIRSTNLYVNGEKTGLLDISQDAPSVFRFGDQTFSFTPHCEINYIENGKYAYHQHNGH